MDKIHIIAEAGSNYNGKVENAKKLIDIAKEAKAESVKFQIINTYGLYLPGKYKYGNYNIDDVIKFRNDCMLDDDSWLEISEYSKNINIPFTASIFDTEGMDLYMKTNPPYVKISSSDLTNIRLLRQVADYNVKIILSTGMATLTEIEKSVNELDKNNFNDLVLMHCTSVYPSYFSETNLNFIKVLKTAFGYPVGFSDHTPTSHAAIIALCFGANWFEKHFTFDKKMPGLDHKHAQDPKELKRYVQDIKDAQKAITFNKDKVSAKEHYTKQRARRGLYAATSIKKGEKITDDMIYAVRPQAEIDAQHIDSIVNKYALREIKQYEQFKWEDISNPTNIL